MNALPVGTNGPLCHSDLVSCDGKLEVVPPSRGSWARQTLRASGWIWVLVGDVCKEQVLQARGISGKARQQS